MLYVTIWYMIGCWNRYKVLVIRCIVVTGWTDGALLHFQRQLCIDCFDTTLCSVYISSRTCWWSIRRKVAFRDYMFDTSLLRFNRNGTLRRETLHTGWNASSCVLLWNLFHWVTLGLGCLSCLLWLWGALYSLLLILWFLSDAFISRIQISIV
jgi:hypothetical protein